MASQGPLYPTTMTSDAAVAPEDDDAWVNPTNVGSDNGAEAQITAASFDSPDISRRLSTSGYGFTIPVGSTIDGIVVEVERRSIIANSGVDNRVQLRDAAGALVGANKATATVWPTSATIATYGGAADTWTANPTVAMVNDPDFGVVLSAKANIANADIGVDFIRVTVHYTPPAPEEHSGTLSVSGGGGVTPTAAKGGVTALVLSGGGSAAIMASRGAGVALGVAGGGSASFATVSGRQAALGVAGGGGVTPATVASRAGPLTVTGGGSVLATSVAARESALSISTGGGVTIEAIAGGGGSEEHFGTLAVGGGGGVTVAWRGDHLGTLTVTSGGGVAFPSGSALAAALEDVLVALAGRGQVEAFTIRRRGVDADSRLEACYLRMDEGSVVAHLAWRRARRVGV